MKWLPSSLPSRMDFRSEVMSLRLKALATWDDVRALGQASRNVSGAR
jgi:hypothetical protein